MLLSFFLRQHAQWKKNISEPQVEFSNETFSSRFGDFCGDCLNSKCFLLNGITHSENVSSIRLRTKMYWIYLQFDKYSVDLLNIENIHTRRQEFLYSADSSDGLS